MIVTKNWLEEWVDLEGIAPEEILRVFNAIGLEVDSAVASVMPEKTVVGLVKTCEKHPEADKLSICQVDVGSEKLQIVCGAKNVAVGQYVVVAKSGATLPGGLAIKPTKLRGVSSNGMICSAEEIGLPKVMDGILVLDSSVGLLMVGRELTAYPLLNDWVIEIELTANRGDCLSVRGIARELAAYFSRNLKEVEPPETEEKTLGIGRIFQFTHTGKPKASLLFHAIDIEALSVPLLHKIRLGWVDALEKENMANVLAYAMHSLGVVLRAYAIDRLKKTQARAQLHLKRTKGNLGRLVCGDQEVSIVGVTQSAEFAAGDKDASVLIEASYVAPEVLAPAVKANRFETDPLYYRTSRGSEPNLRMGIDWLDRWMATLGKVKSYSGFDEYVTEIKPVSMHFGNKEVETIIGMNIPANRVAGLLSRLEFDIQKKDEQNIVLTAPAFRHDILNQQDVVEEVLRMFGIDNIPSKPLAIHETNQENGALVRYKYIRALRERAVAVGFYETVHYLFCDSKIAKRLGFPEGPNALALTNPIVNEMDRLRPSLLVNMVQSAKKNINASRRSVKLFEAGQVYDEKRDAALRLGLLSVGDAAAESIRNSGKAPSVTFQTIVGELAHIIGDFRLQTCIDPLPWMHPYQAADIIKDQQKVGVIAVLHPKIADDLDLPPAVYAECGLDALMPKFVIASSYSLLTPIQRDLSIVIDDTLPYAQIRTLLDERKPETVDRFFPIDLYKDPSMPDKQCLTLRFILQPEEQTLDESAITATMQTLIELLSENVAASLR